MVKPLYSGQFIVDTFFESRFKVLTWKNHYTVDRAEKIEGIKLDFDKFLYFRHLETLHSSSFPNDSNFFFNQSMVFLRP